MRLLKQASYFVFNFIWRHRVSLLAVICGNRGFFVLQTTVRKRHLDFKVAGTLLAPKINREGGEVLRKTLFKGIKNNY